LAIAAAEVQGFFDHCAYKKVSGSLICESRRIVHPAPAG
jgi:hypothetical protein